VFAFCRLRLPDPKTQDQRILELLPEIKGAAFIRELHTYGTQLALGASDEKASQHRGLGRKLMVEAERIAKAAGFKKMAVISGIGVREYYRKLGYRLEGSYMVKKIQPTT
ncbi:MAG: GNAT family N-acetyltransferase, partial [bacterium]